MGLFGRHKTRPVAYHVTIVFHALTHVPTSGSVFLKWHPAGLATDRTGVAQVTDNAARWEQRCEFDATLRAREDNHMLQSMLVRVSVKQEKRGRGTTRLGLVFIDLSEYGDRQELASRVYVLQHSQVNAQLLVSISMKQTSGDPLVRARPVDSSKFLSLSSAVGAAFTGVPMLVGHAEQDLASGSPMRTPAYSSAAAPVAAEAAEPGAVVLEGTARGYGAPVDRSEAAGSRAGRDRPVSGALARRPTGGSSTSSLGGSGAATGAGAGTSPVTESEGRRAHAASAPELDTGLALAVGASTAGARTPGVSAAPQRPPASLLSAAATPQRPRSGPVPASALALLAQAHVGGPSAGNAVTTPLSADAPSTAAAEEAGIADPAQLAASAAHPAAHAAEGSAPSSTPPLPRSHGPSPASHSRSTQAVEASGASGASVSPAPRVVVAAPGGALPSHLHQMRAAHERSQSELVYSSLPGSRTLDGNGQGGGRGQAQGHHSVGSRHVSIPSQAASGRSRDLSSSTHARGHGHSESGTPLDAALRLQAHRASLSTAVGSHRAAHGSGSLARSAAVTPGTGGGPGFGRQPPHTSHPGEVGREYHSWHGLPSVASAHASPSLPASTSVAGSQSEVDCMGATAATARSLIDSIMRTTDRHRSSVAMR